MVYRLELSMVLDLLIKPNQGEDFNVHCTMSGAICGVLRLSRETKTLYTVALCNLQHEGYDAYLLKISKIELCRLNWCKMTN